MSTRKKGGIDLNFFMAKEEPFLLQTAKDYDMTYEQVVRIYNNNIGRDRSEFYNDLESFIEGRKFRENS